MFNGAINNFPCLAQVLYNLITCCLSGTFSWTQQKPSSTVKTYMRVENMGDKDMSRAEVSLILLLGMVEPWGSKWSTAGEKKPGDLCVRGHRRINFPTKLRSTIKLKSIPKTPKRDLKNNIFTRQHLQHPYFHKGQVDRSKPIGWERLNALGSSSWPSWVE